MKIAEAIVAAGVEFVTIKPLNQREEQITKQLGHNGWLVLKRDRPACMDNQPSVLIEKARHMRWVREHQVTTEK